MKRLALTSGMGVSVEGQQQDGSGTLHSELFGERTGAVRRLVRVITGWLETVEHRFDAFAGVRYAVLIQGGEQALTRHLVGCQFDRSEERRVGKECSTRRWPGRTIKRERIVEARRHTARS